MRRQGLESSIEGGSVEVSNGEPLECELRDFVRAVQTRGRPLVDGHDGRRALALAQKVADAISSTGDRGERG